MPDGRVLSYGTTAAGQQTGHSIYDIWDPAAGLDAGASDAAQHSRHGHFLQFAGGPAAGQPGFHRGRRQLDRHRHDEHGQQQQQHGRLQQQFDHPQRRHEPAALVLVVHRAAERRGLYPGRLRRHGSARDPRHQRRLPAADRRRHERPRFHVPAQFRRAGRPRFRLRQQRPHVLRQHQRRGLRDAGRNVQRSDGIRLECRDVPAGQDPADRRQLEHRARHRHHRRLAGRLEHEFALVAAPAGHGHRARRRPRARDRWQRRSGTR